MTATIFYVFTMLLPVGKKNPLLAAVFSVFIAGLGQFYVDRFWRGMLFLIAEVATASYSLFGSEQVGFILNIGVSFVAAADAYKLAKAGNEVVPKPPEPKELFI